MDNPIADTRSWIRRKLKHLTIGTVIVIAAVLLFFAWLSWHFYIGDDLILNMDANQTSFRITNVDVASANITIGTAGQLFCTAKCNFTLTDADGKLLETQTFLLTADQETSKVLTLEPGRVGTGQKLYSATTSCTNIRSWICPTLSPERRTTILLSVNYALPGDEAELKPMLRTQLLGMLQSLRDTDIALLSVRELLVANPRLHPGDLLANSTGLQDAFGQQNLFLEHAKKLWIEESYTALGTLLATSEITNGSIVQTREDAQSLYGKLHELPLLHNRLRDELDATRMSVNESLTFLHDPVVRNSADALLNATDTLTSLYARDQFEYGTLANMTQSLRGQKNDFDGLVITRTAQVVAAGNVLLALQYADACSQNITCRDFNIPTNASSNLTTIAALCAELHLTNATQSYMMTYCNATATLLAVNMTPLLPVELVLPNITSTIDTALPENVPQCCVFGACKECCAGSACINESYPVVFVHGHSFSGANSPEYSLGGYFTNIQQRLQHDGYIDAGIVTPSSTFSDVQAGEWGLSGHPVSVRITYYYNFYRDGTNYVLIPQKSENIETYAIRLKESIEIIKHNTGKQKVNIVAHSMGGLVARRYIQLFGEGSVNKIILIATPNHGITGSTLRLCPVLGASKECEDMAAGSVFLEKLNDPANQPEDVEVITIRGLGCPTDDVDGDGVATGESVKLDFAQNNYLRGTCTDLFGSDFHTEILNADKYPIVYDFIAKELKK